MGKQPIETYNRDFEFSWKFKNYKIRTVHEDWKDSSSELRKDCPIELVKYCDDTHNSCYTIAWFQYDDRGYELHSVGARLLEEIDAEDIAEIWSQLQAGQKMLNAYYEACCKNEKFE